MIVCTSHGFSVNFVFINNKHFVIIRKSIVEFDLDSVKFDTSRIVDQNSKEYMNEASQVFMSSLKKLCTPNCVSCGTAPVISISTSTPFDYIKLTTDESYVLIISTEGNLYTTYINYIIITTYDLIVML